MIGVEDGNFALDLDDLVKLPHLNGYDGAEGQDEEKTRGFFRYAVSLGADPATWTRSQFVRMPGGRRDNGKVQLVCYLNPVGVRLAAKRV